MNLHVSRTPDGYYSVSILDHCPTRNAFGVTVRSALQQFIHQTTEEEFQNAFSMTKIMAEMMDEVEQDESFDFPFIDAHSNEKWKERNEPSPAP